MRRTSCPSWWASLIPSAAALVSASSIRGVTPAKAASSMPEPRAWYSGPAASLPVVESTTITMEMNPSSPRIRRSFREVSVTSPTDRHIVIAEDRAGDGGLPVHQVDDHAVLGDYDVPVLHP